MEGFLLINVETEEPTPILTEADYSNMMNALFEVGVDHIWEHPDTQSYVFVNWHHNNWERLADCELVSDYGSRN